MESNFNYRDFEVKDCVLKNEYEVAAEAEFSLADYCPPIKRVLCYNISPAISSKNVTGNMINFDGVACLRVIYLDEEDNICSYENSFVFSKNIESEDDVKGCKIKCAVSSEKVALRALSERKIEIRGNFTLFVTVERACKKRYLCCDSLRDCEVKTRKIPVKERVVFAEKSIIIEDDIELSDSHAEIDKILNCKGKICPDSSKIMNGKVMVKGSLEVCVTYLSNEGVRSCNIKEKIPYSQVIDLEGVDDGYTVKTEEQLVFLEVKCRKGGYEDRRTLVVNAKICVGAEASLNREETVILDMYSTACDLQTEYDRIRTKRLIDRVNESFQVKKSLEFSEGTVGAVLELNGDVKTNGIKINEDSVVVYGTAYIRILLMDQSEMPQYSERTVDFEYKYPLSISLPNSFAEANIGLSNLNYIISSDCTLELMCELSVSLSLFENDEVALISSATRMDREKSDDGCAVYVCFADKECDIWDLAKKYKSNVKEICSVNRIEGNTDKISGVLVIPAK